MTDLSFEDAVQRVKTKLNPKTMEKLASVIGFHFIDIDKDVTIDAHGANGKGWLEGKPGSHALEVPFEVTLTSKDFAELVSGKLNPMAGMVTGRMKLKGDIRGALRLDRLLKE